MILMIIWDVRDALVIVLVVVRTVVLVAVQVPHREGEMDVTSRAPQTAQDGVMQRVPKDVKMVVQADVKALVIKNAKAIVGELVKIHVLNNVQQIAATF